MKKIVSLLLATLFIVAALSGCSWINGRESYGIYLESGLTSLDPALCNSTSDAIIISQAFRGLYKIDNTQSLKSDLASKYTVSEDGLTYIFDLVSGIPWSGSKEDVTADDVVFSWKRAAELTVKNNSNYAYLFSNIAGYQEALTDYQNGKDFDADKLQISIVKNDDTKNKKKDKKHSGKNYTLSVTLKEKDNSFLEKLTYPVFYPVNKTTVEENGNNWASKAETCHCNSVYKLRDIKAKENISFLDIESSYISLIINNKYEEYNVDSAEITLYFLTDADKGTVIDKFKEDSASDKDKNKMIYVGNLSKNDVIDWKNFVNQKDSEASKADEKEIEELKAIVKTYTKDLQSSASNSEYYLSFNTKVEPFNNVLVRKALTLAIDRKYISEIACIAGNEVPAEAIISDGFTDSCTSKTIREISGNYFNSDRYENYLEKAKDCLAKAGYPNGEGFPDIRYLYNGEDKVAATVAESVRKAWTDLGISSVFIESATGSSYTNALHSDIYGVIGTSYNLASAVDVLDMFTTGSEFNYSNWSNEEYDQILKDIHENLDIILNSQSGHKESELTDENATEDLENLFKAINNSKVAISPIIRDAEDILFESEGWIVAPIYAKTHNFLCEESLANTYTSNYGITYFNLISFTDD